MPEVLISCAGLAVGVDAGGDVVVVEVLAEAVGEVAVVEVPFVVGGGWDGRDLVGGVFGPAVDDGVGEVGGEAAEGGEEDFLGVGLVGGRVGDGAPDVSVEGEFFSVGVCDDVDGEGAAVFGEFEACYVGLEGWVSVEGGGGSWAVGPYGVAVFG